MDNNEKQVDQIEDEEEKNILPIKTPSNQNSRVTSNEQSQKLISSKSDETKDKDEK